MSEQQFDGDGAFDLRKLLRELSAGWMIILACVIAAVAYAAHDLRSEIYYYAGVMEVTPAQANDTGGAPNLGALGSLASLAGVLPSSQNTSQFSLYFDTLYSRELAEQLSHDQKLMRTLFAGEWDESAQAWREPPPNWVKRLRDNLGQILGIPPTPWQPPNAERLQTFLQYAVKINQDPRKPSLVTVEFDYPDANFAVSFLNMLHRVGDNQLRQRALFRARQSINYLSGQLTKVTLAEHRLAIAQALSDEEKYAMNASSGAPFAAEIFDQPYASTTPVEPEPRKEFLTAIFVGGTIGAAFVLGLRKIRARFSARRLRLRARLAPVLSTGAE